MKKLAIIIASIMLLAPISEALAGGAAWVSSQRRMRRAYLKWEKQQAELWKKFDAEMAQAAKEAGSNVSVLRRK